MSYKQYVKCCPCQKELQDSEEIFFAVKGVKIINGEWIETKYGPYSMMYICKECFDKVRRKKEMEEMRK